MQLTGQSSSASFEPSTSATFFSSLTPASVVVCVLSLRSTILSSAYAQRVGSTAMQLPHPMHFQRSCTILNIRGLPKVRFIYVVEQFVVLRAGLFRDVPRELVKPRRQACGRMNCVP